VEVVAEPGEVVAILGPNGAGKTTFLRALAGLIPLDAGRVSVRGAVLEDPAAGVRLTPQDRHVGVVFQDHLLFPHLTAVDNVAFGRQARGERRTAARQHAREWLDRVGLGEHADERPGALSGGQAQRVALARALATDPHLLLLDEPMAALDVDARREIRRELRRHLAAFGGPTLLITHEPLEAITLADRLVILEGGRIVQDAPPREIARRPRSDWAARLVGLNLYRGTGRDHDVELADGTVLATGDRVASGELYVVIHPRAVVLHAEQPVGSARNVWQATVDSLDLYEDHVRVHLVGGVPIVAQITPAALAELALGEGSRVWVAVKATEVDAWVA
jgi:molybdate transport system ATP-binding protein